MSADTSGVRFRFGENWQSFVATLTPASIAEAERALDRLFPDDTLGGKRFLDIGCGSGLAALAACRRGAREVDALDLDPRSVAAAQAVLSRHAPGGHWRVRHASVLDLAPERDGTYDIVHSWGVLHHTGAMWAAVARAAAMTAPHGRLALALYRKTPLCRLWRWEKRLYAASGAPVQAGLRALYKGAFRAGLVATGRSPARYVAGYVSARGMDWHHDVHDWLGGYPYESTDPDEVAARLAGLGFALERVFAHAPVACGVFGSHCDEYVARRNDAAREDGA